MGSGPATVPALVPGGAAGPTAMDMETGAGAGVVVGAEVGVGSGSAGERVFTARAGATSGGVVVPPSDPMVEVGC